jgi:3-oxoacyl-[acyl-carrier protein] reductase
MNDFLLTLGKNQRARALVRALGLPLPLPVSLRRDDGPWRERPLADAHVVVGSTSGAKLASAIAECIASAGADPYLASPDTLSSAFRGPGETFGRPARALSALGEDKRVDALLFDATGIHDVAGLRALHEFFHPLVGRLNRSGRVIILARSPEGAVPEAAGAQAAVDGFVRSVAKEIGRIGATANLLLVAQDAEARLAPVLRFMLSAKSAFITAQPVAITARARQLPEPPLVRPLEKKIALVTGAARGIGEATARALAREGAHVVCLDRPADTGPTSQLARSIGGTAIAVDLAAKDATAAIDAALRPLGGIDVLVNNAGVTRDKTLARMSLELWDQVLDVNLGATMAISSAVDPLIRDNGRIICLSSVSGLAGNVGQSSYAASKAGIVGFVAAMANRLAGRGITVNAVAPGFIETRMTAAMPVAIREVARRLSALGQGGRPEDVAQAIVFLASPGAQGITGRTLRVCGGAFVGA